MSDATRRTIRDWFKGLPGWARFATSIITILTVLGTVAMALIGLGRWWERTTYDYENVPTRVQTLWDSVITDQVNVRLRQMETQQDSIRAQGRRQQSSLDGIRDLLDEQKEQTERIVCLLELQQGNRNYLDCR